MPKVPRLRQVAAAETADVSLSWTADLNMYSVHYMTTDTICWSHVFPLSPFILHATFFAVTFVPVEVDDISC